VKSLRIVGFFVALILSLSSYAQVFSGRIVKADSLKTPFYQATCKAIAAKDTQVVQTYFDGSFKLNLKPFSFYKIVASYVGYKDTTIEISTDGKGNSIVNTVVFALRKDGMRLMGNLFAAEDETPISKANLILKNIMTRQESRFTTGIDGYYNFKLDYEANYQLKVDKYSEGIMNVYQDTSFYISTIGFNMPLDFKFDIRLGKSVVVVKPRVEKEVASINKPQPAEPIVAKKPEPVVPPVVAPVAEVPKSVVETKKQEPIQKTVTTKVSVDSVGLQAKATKENRHEKHKNPTAEKKVEVVKKDTPMVVSNTKPVVAQSIPEKPKKEHKHDKKKHESTSVAKIDSVVVKPNVTVAKKDMPKAKKALSEEDSARLKEKIIIDAQKEIERQNQFALDRQKREAYEASQRDMLRYYENKAQGKNEDPIVTNKTIDKAAVESKVIVAQKQEPIEQKYYNYSIKPKKTIIKGSVLDGANQLKMAGVNVSVRPLNSIFSIETQTDKMGYFEAEVDSGGMYIISFFKTDYKISKQFIDLSDKNTKEYTLQDVYLGENVNVDINRDMPAFFFFKNKAELTESVIEELNAIIVLMAKDPSYSIKLIGLAAADENFPKPLSTSRVQSIAQYLVANGVSSTQIKFVALGDTKHRSNCGLSKPCTSEDYDKDRAVVYLITK
jgi:outer membrane protein OmpA-like peptidoglycan-associated protein